MSYILFDHERQNLLPFTHTRAVADIRCGILTMRERWEQYLKADTQTLTAEYLQPIYAAADITEAIYINSAIAATEELIKAIAALTAGEKLVHGQTVIAARLTTTAASLDTFNKSLNALATVNFGSPVDSLERVWHIFSLNDKLIRADYALLTAGRTGAPLPGNITTAGKENIFIEEGAVINAGCIINAATGPVYIGRDAEIMEGTMIRGPLALCDHAVLKMGAKVYGSTTIGPGCKAGGEISNVVFFANSNKGHDGFVGNAVIGEWCNLGADTNSSNLKNNYDEVKIWDEPTGKLVKTGLTFCGLLMGDHSKCGINTMFNTGTVVGVSSNIYGGSFPEKFIPSFSWGGSEGMVTYEFERAVDTANRMMMRRNKQLTAEEIAVLQHIYDEAVKKQALITFYKTTKHYKTHTEHA